MIIQGILALAFMFLLGVIKALPVSTFLDGGALRGWFTGAITLISSTSYFLPWDVVMIAFGCIVFWLAVYFIVDGIRFVLDFIPFF